MSLKIENCYLHTIGILGQVWYLIVSISDLCTLTYFGMENQYNLLVPDFIPSSVQHC